jgi:hypothetical protein
MKPDARSCPPFITIHNKQCERTFNDGAYYRCDAWPFTFRIVAREVGWLWSVEGLSTEKRGVVPHHPSGNTLGSDVEEAVRQAQIAAGDLVRQLLAFTEYKDYDDR